MTNGQQFEFKIWATGYKLPNANGAPIPFTGTFKECWDKMEQHWIEAGSQKYTHVIADYYGSSQMKYPPQGR